MVKITKELQQTLRLKPQIKTIGFDSSGKHYFRMLKLFDDESCKNKSDYGDGKFLKKQSIPNLPEGSEDIKETICIGKPSTKIVTLMSRDEVLEVNVQDSNNSTSQELPPFLKNLSEDKFNKLMALLEDKPEDKSKEEGLNKGEGEKFNLK